VPFLRTRSEKILPSTFGPFETGFGKEEDEPARNKAWIKAFFLGGFHKCVGRLDENLCKGTLDGTIFSDSAVDEVKFAGNKVSTRKNVSGTTFHQLMSGITGKRSDHHCKRRLLHPFLGFIPKYFNNHRLCEHYWPAGQG
jgi:hypothetical protein